MTHGATDDVGYHAVEHRHYIVDLQATILHQLGLDAAEMEVELNGQPLRLVEEYAESPFGQSLAECRHSGLISGASHSRTGSVTLRVFGMLGLLGYGLYGRRRGTTLSCKRNLVRSLIKGWQFEATLIRYFLRRAPRVLDAAFSSSDFNRSSFARASRFPIPRSATNDLSWSFLGLDFPNSQL